MAHVAGGGKFAGPPVEIFFYLVSRRRGAKGEQFVVSGFAGGGGQGAGFFLGFFGGGRRLRERGRVGLAVAVERKIFGAAHSFEQEFAQGNRDGDFRDDVFFERAEKIKAARGVVEDRGRNLR